MKPVSSFVQTFDQKVTYSYAISCKLCDTLRDKGIQEGCLSVCYGIWAENLGDRLNIQIERSFRSFRRIDDATG